MTCLEQIRWPLVQRSVKSRSLLPHCLATSSVIFVLGECFQDDRGVIIYADDTTFFVTSVPHTADCLSSFSRSSLALGTLVFWAKTKIQNISSCSQPPDHSTQQYSGAGRKLCIPIPGQSPQSSNGGSQPDVKRHIVLVPRYQS